MEYTHTHQAPSQYEYTRDQRPGTIGVKTNAFYMMDQIFDGWCTHKKMSVLIDIISACKPKTIVEIGVWGGKSLIPMAYVLKECNQGIIYGIDPWSNIASVEGMMHEGSKAFWNFVDHEDIMRKLEQYIHQFQLEKHVQLIRATSADAPSIPDIDILHIDGNHSEECSWLDVTKWVPLVRKGGWIILDDLNWTENGILTQQKSIDYLNQHCHKIAEINHVCLWGVWYKP